ncbi:hypothetical protein HDV02_004557 [Globomyces sp. JEL0801]|nr:hypothetical protein HDV02_004557 [Globomyces sp. JEL0801]
MSNIFEQFMPSNLNSMSWDNLKLNLTPSVKSHLKKVYTNMAVMLAISAFTCYLDIIGLVSFNYTLTSLAALICLAAFAMTDEITSKDTAQYLLYGFAALKGFSLAPLISLAIDMDSSIIFTALVSTALVFISFSLSVMYSVNRQNLYITGMQ